MKNKLKVKHLFILTVYSQPFELGKLACSIVIWLGQSVADLEPEFSADPFPDDQRSYIFHPKANIHDPDFLPVNSSVNGKTH